MAGEATGRLHVAQFVGHHLIGLLHKIRTGPLQHHRKQQQYEGREQTGIKQDQPEAGVRSGAA